jgi:hypothetical protein
LHQGRDYSCEVGAWVVEKENEEGLTIPEIVNITPLYEELGTNLDERGPDGGACHLLDIGLCGRQTKGDFCDFV